MDRPYSDAFEHLLGLGLGTNLGAGSLGLGFRPSEPQALNPKP